MTKKKISWHNAIVAVANTRLVTVINLQQQIILKEPKILKEKTLCINCLGTQHIVEQSYSFIWCHHCKKTIQLWIRIRNRKH
jgi:hypothetical protein